MDFQGKTVFITRSVSFLGKAVACALGRAGANIILQYKRNSKEVEALIQELSVYGRRILPLKADLSNIDSCKQMIADVRGEFKSLDIFVNYVELNDQGFFLKVTPQQWKRIIERAADEAYNCIRFASSLMKKQKYGKIINVTDYFKENYLSYALLKSNIVSLTKILGRELARENVYMNAIVPGLIESPGCKKLMETYKTELKLYLAAGRAAKIEEVVEPILFLASDEASYIFAEAIKVDGGFAA